MNKYLIFFFIFLPFWVQAEQPMFISLAELSDTAHTIVVCKYLEPGPDSPFGGASEYHLDVIKSLRGEVEAGPFTVKRGNGMADILPGTLCIAFMSGDMEWSWVGIPRNTAQPWEGVWDLSGFYDFNAYLVGPSMLTLGQLKRYLDGEPLAYQLQGPLAFFDPVSGELKDSDYQLSFTWKPESQEAWEFKSDLPLVDFDQPESAWISNGFEPDFSARFQSSQGGRAMEIYGMIRSLDGQTGVMKTCFWLYSPKLYTEEMLLPFLKDYTCRHPWYEIEIDLEDGRTWILEWDKEYGNIGDLVLENGRRIELNTADGEGLWVKAGKDSNFWKIEAQSNLKKDQGFILAGTDGAFIQSLLLGEMNGKWSREKNGIVSDSGKCKWKLKKTHWTRYR